MSCSPFMKAITVLGMAITCLVVAPHSHAQDDNRPVVDDSKVLVEVVANAALPTLHLVGDSTLKSNAPMRGWAQEIGSFFDLTKINVVNHAIGGRSSRSFQREGRWDKVLADLKPNDYVIIQFGHNDWGAQGIGAEGKFRSPLSGLGEETQEVTLTDGTIEKVHTFGWYMRKYGTDAKAKGANVIFCSMVPHKDWQDGKIKRGERESLVKWTADSAKRTGAAFVDLNEIVAQQFEKLGQARVEPFFADKRTHSTPLGAEFNAQSVIAGLRALPSGQFETYLSAKGQLVVPVAEFVTAASESKPD
jgi:rhamnogalacturonan acetylesterase